MILEHPHRPRLDFPRCTIARGDARAADRHFRAAGSLDPAYRHQPRPDAATARVE